MRGAAARVHGAWSDDERPASHTPKFSFEYFPPKTPAVVETLYNRVYRMSRQGPLFLDLTWGAGGSTSELPLSMSANFKRLFGAEVNMHLTCTNITKQAVHDALIKARETGLTSICALRGDPPAGTENWTETAGGFACALDLVKFIRREHGDYFSVAVSGYPEGHPTVIKPVSDETKLSETEKSRLINIDGQLMVCSDEDFANEIRYLKQKVDAGGNIVITQLFLDAKVFLAFVDTCRTAGITVPILPGIMVFTQAGSLKRMTDLCKTRVPPEMQTRIDECKGDDKRFTAFALEYLTSLCQQVWASNKVPELHFYCLNQHSMVFNVLANLGVRINPLDTPPDRQLVEHFEQEIKAMLNGSQSRVPKERGRDEEDTADGQKRAKTQTS